MYWPTHRECLNSPDEILSEGERTAGQQDSRTRQQHVVPSPCSVPYCCTPNYNKPHLHSTRFTSLNVLLWQFFVMYVLMKKRSDIPYLVLKTNKIQTKLWGFARKQIHPQDCGCTKWDLRWILSATMAPSQSFHNLSVRIIYREEYSHYKIFNKIVEWNHNQKTSEKMTLLRRDPVRCKIIVHKKCLEHVKGL